MKLAIISTNKDKYSETFIKNQVEFLPAEIHYLYGGYLPKFFRKLVGKGTPFDSKIISNDFNVINEKDKSHLVKCIANYLTNNNISAVLANYGPSGVEIMNICHQYNIPLVVHFHGYDAYRSDILDSFGREYHRLFEKASAIIAVSKDMYKQLRKLKADKNKISIIPCGYNDSIFSYHPVNRESKQFVSCGRFVEKKGPDISINAFAELSKKYPDCTLKMVGEGPLLNHCKSLVKKIGIQDSVSFVGIKTQKEINAIYNNSCGFLLHSLKTSSRDSEGTPVALLEAAACGLPVITTDHAGNNEVITHKRTGFIVEEGNKENMVKYMKIILEDSNLVRQMGKRASKYVSDNYKLNNQLTKLWNVIDRVVN